MKKLAVLFTGLFILSGCGAAANQELRFSGGYDDPKIYAVAKYNVYRVSKYPGPFLEYVKVIKASDEASCESILGKISAKDLISKRCLPDGGKYGYYFDLKPQKQWYVVSQTADELPLLQIWKAKSFFTIFYSKKYWLKVTRGAAGRILDGAKAPGATPVIHIVSPQGEIDRVTGELKK